MVKRSTEHSGLIIEPENGNTKGITEIRSEFSLYAQWVAKDPNVHQVDSEDSDQVKRMGRLRWVFAGCTYHCVVLLCSGSIIFVPVF